MIEFLYTSDYKFLSEPFSGGVTERVYFNWKPCWEAWDVYMFNSDFLPARSRHILGITFCLSPSPSLWEAALLDVLFQARGWPSLQPRLLLLTPIRLLPVAGAFQSLSAPPPHCAPQACLPRLGSCSPALCYCSNVQRPDWVSGPRSVRSMKKKLEGSMCTATCSLKRHREMSEC